MVEFLLVLGLITSVLVAAAVEYVQSERRRARLARVRQTTTAANRAIFTLTQEAQAEMVRILMASRRQP